MDWYDDLEELVDKSSSQKYSDIKRLKKDGFTGYLRINFDGGNVGNINIYCTIRK